jgi:hypothetical protein
MEKVHQEHLHASVPTRLHGKAAWPLTKMKCLQDKESSASQYSLDAMSDKKLIEDMTGKSHGNHRYKCCSITR